GIIDLICHYHFLAAVAIGLGTTVVSWGHASHGDASVMIALSLWVQSVATLQPTPGLLTGVDLIFKIHLFFGMTVFLLFPFTRLVHVWSVPITYLGRAYQIVRVKRITMN
ncbi:MAG: respiratory nitrate reductase subunit gamma, partial [Planctomycetes bacterium]|nr:respiratory nitrate reductase subunit gamma [Planctomycetota bacterium]